MLSEHPQWMYAVVTLFVLILFRESKTRRKRLHLPPGPSPLPLIGNVLDMPRKHLGSEFYELTKKFGDVVYLDALGQPMLILGSYKAARDLLDKRSANYSDRPTSIMGELTGQNRLFVLESYGNKWRLYRRVFHQSFNSEAISQYEPIQLATARRLLSSLLQAPKDVAGHVKFSFASSLMRVAYGIELEEENDEYFHMIEEIGVVGEAISVPGNFPVEVIPALRYLPSWVPGGGFKQWAADAKVFFQSTLNKLFSASVDAIHTGVGLDSFVSRLLDDSGSFDLKGGGEPDLEVFIKNLAIMIYAAGADTSYNAMQAFFLAMAMHPEAQRKAQEELDRVVGSERLPEFEDRSSLPYLSALLKEVLRWHPVTPIGVPHRAVADDEYNGWYIPAGTIVTANVWGLARDPEVFPDPDSFVPERFLDENGRLDVSKGDPTDFVFGFGRRICPGRHFAEASLFILAASILHAFEIRPPMDEQGAPRKLESKRTEAMGVISHANVYPYDVKPRSARAEQLILESCHIIS